MEKWFLHTAKRLQGGQLASGLGFVGYIILLGVGVSQRVLLPLLTLVVLAAVWTVLSAWTWPPERKKELPRSFFWSQGALTLLAAALLVLTAKEALGL